ncbi:MAG: hypothetical protein ACFE8A_02930 [Candidatus Hodarchaeota archaeon]
MGGIIALINDNFKSNWLKILNYNSNVEIFDDAKKLKERIRIPLTPINTEGYVIYYLFKLLYPIFINDQQNILDVVISDNGKEILKLFLYETKKAGIHESFQIVPKEWINFQWDDLHEINEIFSAAQSGLIEKKNVRISSLRIFKKKAINYINDFCIGINELNFYEFMLRIFDLVQNILEYNVFFIYPEPNILKFLKKLIIYLKGIKLSNIFKFIEGNFDSFNVSIVLNSEQLILILKIQKIKSSSEKSDLNFKLYTPRELGINVDGISITHLLNKIKFRLKSEKIFLINQNHILSLLPEIFELDIPPKIENLKLILQKILFGFRSFENLWYMAPRPKIYNTLRRFIVRLIGLNLNLKKISHWAFPELISTSIGSNFGLYSKIMFIFTNISKYKKLKLDDLKKIFEYAILIEIENGKLQKIIPINRDDIFTNGKATDLEIIRYIISEKYGFVSSVIKIDNLLIKEVLNNFGSNLSKFKPFSKLKILKLLKNKNIFNIYPDLPPFKLITNNGVKYLTKLVLPILIDKHEF